jgi:IS605 OrfB family transposase
VFYNLVCGSWQFGKRGHRDFFHFTTSAIRVDDARHVILPRLGRLRRAQRVVSRRHKGSARRRRAIRRLARIHARVGYVRRHHIDALSTRLAKSHGTLVVGDLNVRGMSRSARGTVEEPGRNVSAKAGLNRSLADQSFGAVRRMLGYKCRWYGSHLVVAPRSFPSSKALLRLRRGLHRAPARGARLPLHCVCANGIWYPRAAACTASWSPCSRCSSATAPRPR